MEMPLMTLQREIQGKKSFRLISGEEVPPASLEKYVGTYPQRGNKHCFLLGKLSYCGFFDWYSSREETLVFLEVEKIEDPKIIFKMEGLTLTSVLTHDRINTYREQKHVHL